MPGARMIDGLAFRRERIISALRHRDRLAFQVGEHLIAVQVRFAEVTENEKAARDAFDLFISGMNLSPDQAERFIDLRHDR